MATDLFSQPAVWGLAGSFIYAAPLFSTCAFTAKASGGSSIRCGLEFVTALAIGALGAAAVAPLILELTNKDTAAWMRAVATLAGLLSNRVAPMIVTGGADAVIGWANRMFKRSDH